MKLNERLKELRKQTGLTVKAAAKQAGLSASYMTDLEKGRTNPSLVTLITLSQVFHITLVDFLTGVDFAGETTDKALPVGLKELFDDPEFSGEIDEDWQELLKKIEVKGIRPQTKRDWMKLYLAPRQVIDDVK